MMILCVCGGSEVEVVGDFQSSVVLAQVPNEVPPSQSWMDGMYERPFSRRVDWAADGVKSLKSLRMLDVELSPRSVLWSVWVGGCVVVAGLRLGGVIHLTVSTSY